MKPIRILKEIKSEKRLQTRRVKRQTTKIIIAKKRTEAFYFQFLHEMNINFNCTLCVILISSNRIAVNIRLNNRFSNLFGKTKISRKLKKNLFDRFHLINFFSIFLLCSFTRCVNHFVGAYTRSPSPMSVPFLFHLYLLFALTYWTFI